MIFCISLTELCVFSFFSCNFKVDKNIFCFPFLKNIRILKWDSPGSFVIVPLLKNAHILRMGESERCQVGLCFPSPGPHSKTLKTSALSSDQTSSKIPFHGWWSSARAPVLYLRFNSVSSPQALVTVFETYPGALKQIRTTDTWDLWREMVTLPSLVVPWGWCFILSWELMSYSFPSQGSL